MFWLPIAAKKPPQIATAKNISHFIICHEFRSQEFGQGSAENSSVPCGVAQGPWLCAAAGGWTGLLTRGNDWKAELSGDC